MSLVKLDSLGDARETWYEKKSLKRLKVILKKCKINLNNLEQSLKTLKSHNLPTKEVKELYSKWYIKVLAVDIIVYHYESKSN